MHSSWKSRVGGGCPWGFGQILWRGVLGIVRKPWGSPFSCFFCIFRTLPPSPPPSMDGFIELRKKYQTIVNVHTRVHGVLIILVLLNPNLKRKKLIFMVRKSKRIGVCFCEPSCLFLNSWFSKQM